MSLFSPLRVDTKAQNIKQNRTEKGSVDNFIELLINTPVGEVTCDPKFGFIFSNMRFEMFNESEGVIHSSTKDEGSNSLYHKKISGTSKSINTFANELRVAIGQYEPRLGDLSVSMTYARDQRKIFITIKGVLLSTKSEYQYVTTINVWS